MKLAMEKKQIEKSMCPKPSYVILYHLDDVLMQQTRTNRKE